MELLELIHYKLAYQLLFFFKNTNHPNIILHGCTGSGKTTLVKTILSHIYPSEIKKKETTEYSVHLNNAYYYFNCSSILNKGAFLDYFKALILTYDYYHSQSKYIILDHFEEVSVLLQNSLKVIIEKACYTSKIIIITNKFNKVVEPIKSRCVSMKVPIFAKYDKYIYLKESFVKKNILFDDGLLDKCNLDIQEIINHHTIENYENIKTKVFQDMKEVIHYKIVDLEKLKKFRKLASTIKELNISFTGLIKRFILDCQEIDFNIVKECSENEYMLQKSYRTLIHVEHLLLNLNLMINK